MLAWLALLTALGLVVYVALDLGLQVARLDFAPPSPTLEPGMIKVAYYLPPPSFTPTLAVPIATSTFVPTAIPSLIVTRTRTPSPTRRPSSTPSLAATRTVAPRAAIRVITPTATATLPPTPVTPPPVSLNESFALLSVLERPDERSVERHPDVNLTLRSFVPTTATLALVDYTGDTDPGAPQLAGLFTDNRAPAFTASFRVYDWNWTCNCRGALIDDPEVTLLGLRTSPGEVIRVPAAGSEIGSGYSALVLYADGDQIALKYTRSDGAADGYTLHVQTIGVDANLLALYQQANSLGRAELPALRAGQAFAQAKTSEVRVAIRDAGTFLDPRSRKDWWRGR